MAERSRLPLPAIHSMIGVLADTGDRRIAREFFELFKTPWEEYRDDRSYEITLCCGKVSLPPNTRVGLIYDHAEHDFDRANRLKITKAQRPGWVGSKESQFPIYCGYATLLGDGATILREDTSRDAVGLSLRIGDQVALRVGFNLFQEISYLLTRGQPPENARIPTLEMHISFLRDLIVKYCKFLVEIPPQPAGFPYAVCLTHDVDHVAIRNHGWDHTMFGFLGRALLGSWVNFFRGKRPLSHVLINWMAVFSLPLVHLGLAKDTWNRFERYLELEHGLASTFFFIPLKGEPGEDKSGARPAKRASNYEMVELKSLLHRLRNANCEVALHGLDAWRDRGRADTEIEAFAAAADSRPVGVRMHWLFFDSGSPAILEQSGFSYDSTFGYNNVIGYRAGTLQAFVFTEAKTMLELPMHIMDTALFYPSYMDLSFEEAQRQIAPLLADVERFGGVLTVNWHDRSIAPERNWEEPYEKLLEALKARKPWFATATQVSKWFRQRRNASFAEVDRQAGSVRIKVDVTKNDENLPPLIVRVHRSRPEGDTKGSCYTDIPIRESGEVCAAV